MAAKGELIRTTPSGVEQPGQETPRGSGCRCFRLNLLSERPRTPEWAESVVIESSGPPRQLGRLQSYRVHALHNN